MTLHDNDGFESGSEDDLFYAERDWRRLQERSITTGYREGLDHAAEEALQQGFDKAYVEGWKWGVEIGKLRGRIAAKKLMNMNNQNILDHLSLVEEELNKIEKSKTIDKSELERMSSSIDSV